MAFASGAEALQSAKAASEGGGSFGRVPYFKLEDGEMVVVRFLTDPLGYTDDAGTDYPGWLATKMHSMVPTRSKPEGFKGEKWPRVMGAVCRYDRGIDGKDCFICDSLRDSDGRPFKAPVRLWALAVIREEHREDGKVVGYKDKSVEVAQTDKDGKPTGEIVKQKQYVLVNMGYKNFFGPLSGTAELNEGTLLDRDVAIRREGKGASDTNYAFATRDRVPYKGDPVFDLRIAAHRERYADAPNLVDLVTDKGSEDYYVRFFDTRKTPNFSGGKDTPAVEKPATEGSEDDNPALSALRNRVTESAGVTAAAAPSTSSALDE